MAFSFARWFARGWVEARLPERFLRWDDRLARRAIGTVVLVRVLTYLPPAADWFFGVSRVNLRQFVTGTAVGILPGTIFIVLAGEEALDRLGAGGPTIWIVLASVIVLAVAVRAVVRGRSALTPAPPPPPTPAGAINLEPVEE